MNLYRIYTQHLTTKYQDLDHHTFEVVAESDEDAKEFALKHISDCYSTYFKFDTMVCIADLELLRAGDIL